ncbi:hypothetical protein Naga_100877g1, partial [Nannochloropsis gaditana]
SLPPSFPRPGSEQAWPIYELLQGPATVYVRIGTAIPSAGHSLESLKGAVRAHIQALQRDLPLPRTLPLGEWIGGTGKWEGDREGRKGEAVVNKLGSGQRAQALPQ